MKNLTSIFCGVTFGLGLAVSGMTNPTKVLNFLDIFGPWDPSLAFVMGGALIVSRVGIILVRGRKVALSGDVFSIPTRRDIDPRLVVGACLFGIGWGLVGLCPGPALAGISRGSTELLMFVVAMIIGIFLFRVVERICSPAISDGKASDQNTDNEA